MRSSAASSRYRTEFAPDRHGAVIVIAAAALAGIALALSDLPLMIAMLCWLVAALVVALEWKRRRQRPFALVLHVPDALRFEWRDSSIREGSLRRWRKLGPLLLLESDITGCGRLDVWLPALPLDDARELLRQLARMRPAVDASV